MRARGLAVGLAAAAFGALLALLLRIEGPPLSPSTDPAQLKSAPARGLLAAGKAAATPPRFNQAPPALQLVPGQPGYDPYKLGYLVGTKDLFDMEPRHAPWAEPMERFIRDELTAVLPRSLPELRLTKIECRTAVCKIQWEGVPGQSQAVQRVLRVVLPGASASWAPKWDEYVVTFQGGEFFSGVPLNDPMATIARIRSHRTYWNELMERGRVIGVDGGAR